MLKAGDDMEPGSPADMITKSHPPHVPYRSDYRPPILSENELGALIMCVIYGLIIFFSVCVWG